jgi:translation initiation factor 1
MGRLVYSSDKGRLCPGCGHPVDDCRCSSKDGTPSTDGVVRVRRETKGRKGKTVTVVTGVPLAEPDLKQLASKLKRRCGSGGSARAGTLEIQGDHVDLLMKELASLGYRVKKAGG